MYRTKLKIEIVLFLAVALTGTGTIVSGALAKDKPPPADPPRTDLSWIDQRIDQWQLTAEERRFDEIGWARDLREAQRLAREQKRPVFLFTYSGSATEANAIALRRC